MPTSNTTHLRLNKLAEGWWRGFRDGRIYDLEKGETHFLARITVQGSRKPGRTRSFPLAERGAWTRAKGWLEADGQDRHKEPGIARGARP